MDTDTPKIRFFTNSAGSNVAYSIHGQGPPLVIPAWWVSHLELDWQQESYRRFFLELGQHHRVIRYDRPGVGLSDRQRHTFTLEDEATTLSDLIDVLDLSSLSILAISCGGPAAILYSHRNPQRIDKLVFIGSFILGKDIASNDIQHALSSLVSSYWGLGSKAILDLFDPSMTSEQRLSLSTTHKQSASADMATNLLQLTFRMDAHNEAKKLLTPALVFHRDKDSTVSLDAGRALAATLPNAQFRILKGRAHLPWSGEGQKELVKEIVNFTNPQSIANPENSSNQKTKANQKHQFLHLGDVWALSYEQTTVHIKDSIGMNDMATLIAHAGQDISAMFLANGQVEAIEHQSDILDQQALAQYRQRLKDISEEKIMQPPPKMNIAMPNLSRKKMPSNKPYISR